MNVEEAQSIVVKDLNSSYLDEDDSLVILEDQTIQKPYGWVFFFESKRYLETGNVIYALGGNGPVVFEVESGRITRLGSALTPAEEIRVFEEQQRSR